MRGTPSASHHPFVLHISRLRLERASQDLHDVLPTDDRGLVQESDRQLLGEFSRELRHVPTQRPATSLKDRRINKVSPQRRSYRCELINLPEKFNARRCGGEEKILNRSLYSGIAKLVITEHVSESVDCNVDVLFLAGIFAFQLDLRGVDPVKVYLEIASQDHRQLDGFEFAFGAGS